MFDLFGLKLSFQALFIAAGIPLMPNFAQYAFSLFRGGAHVFSAVAPAAAPFANEVLTCAMQSELVGSPANFAAGVFIVGSAIGLILG